jgi:hypothetical protein
MRIATPLTWAVALLLAGTGLLSAAGPAPTDRPQPDSGAEARFSRAGGRVARLRGKSA